MLYKVKCIAEFTFKFVVSSSSKKITGGISLGRKVDGVCVSMLLNVIMMKRFPGNSDFYSNCIIFPVSCCMLICRPSKCNIFSWNLNKYAFHIK